MSQQILTGEVVEVNPAREYSAASVIFPLIVFCVLTVAMFAVNGNPFEKFAQPVTRPTQTTQPAAPAQPALVEPQTQPVEQEPLLTPAAQDDQPAVAAPVEARPTLEMGAIPTAAPVPTFDAANFEKQIALQAQRDRQEAESLRAKLDIEKRRAEIGQAAAWGWFWIVAAFAGLVIGLVVVVNVYARSIVANLRKAAELAKAEKTHVQPIHSPTQAENAIDMTVYTCPADWDVVVAWSKYIEETTQGTITRENEYYQFFVDEASKTGFGNWRKFYSWLQDPMRNFVTIDNGQKRLTENYYQWLKHWLDTPPTD